MIDILSGFPENILAFRAHGVVDKDDYENIMIPAFQAGFSRDEKLRVYYEVASDFDHYTAGAMWEDMGLGLSYFDRWESVVVVSDIDWMVRATELFRFLCPCPVKVFSLAEADKAKAWICQK